MLPHWNGNVLLKLVSFNRVLERKVLKLLQIETKYYVSTFLFCFILLFSFHLISFQFFHYFNMSWHLEHVDVIEMFHPDVCKLNCCKVLTPHTNARWKQISRNQNFEWVRNLVVEQLCVYLCTFVKRRQNLFPMFSHIWTIGLFACWHVSWRYFLSSQLASFLFPVQLKHCPLNFLGLRARIKPLAPLYLFKLDSYQRLQVSTDWSQEAYILCNLCSGNLYQHYFSASVFKSYWISRLIQKRWGMKWA